MIRQWRGLAAASQTLFGSLILKAREKSRAFLLQSTYSNLHLAGIVREPSFLSSKFSWPVQELGTSHGSHGPPGCVYWR